jgi:hypothetical protein
LPLSCSRLLRYGSPTMCEKVERRSTAESQSEVTIPRQSPDLYP